MERNRHFIYGGIVSYSPFLLPAFHRDTLFNLVVFIGSFPFLNIVLRIFQRKEERAGRIIRGSYGLPLLVSNRFSSLIKQFKLELVCPHRSSFKRFGALDDALAERSISINIVKYCFAYSCVFVTNLLAVFRSCSNRTFPIICKIHRHCINSLIISDR